MNAATGRRGSLTDGGDVAGGIRVRDDRGQHLVPRAVAGEPGVPLPHRLPRTGPLGQITSGDPTPVALHHALHHLTVIPVRPRRTTHLRLNGSITAHRSARHESPPVRDPAPDAINVRDTSWAVVPTD
jgi:hypothetical protein